MSSLDYRLFLVVIKSSAKQWLSPRPRAVLTILLTRLLGLNRAVRIIMKMLW